MLTSKTRPLRPSEAIWKAEGRGRQALDPVKQVLVGCGGEGGGKVGGGA